MPALLDRLAAWSWRLLVIGGAIVAGGFAVSEIRLVVVPVVAALLLSTVLEPPTRWLERHRLPPLAATWCSFTTFALLIAGSIWLIVPPFVDEFSELGTTISEGADEVERWLVDGPLSLDPERVADARDSISGSGASAATSDGALRSGAILAGEVLAGGVLTMVIAFFLVKDGPRLQRWVLQRAGDERRDVTSRMALAGWTTMRRYLAGAALLGLVEAVIIGLALAVTGTSVVLPVAVLTFVAAFFPFIGALVAGVVAVLVALVAAGPGAAAVVGLVALLVQQLDNDLLAPVVFGRALRLHPLVVVLSLAFGAAVAGLMGAFLAVPVAAVGINAVGAARSTDLGRDPIATPPSR